MERFVKGDVVVLPFPYTDFSSVKKRPAVVIANLRGQNIILAQITTNQRNDEDLISLTRKDFASGSLSSDSFIMAALIFTADASQIEYKAGKIKTEKVKEVQNKLVEVFTR
ncbi:MAG TPA: type II toxin-antitoxin system PemK/MazF family toxin [Candidatus Nanoarchaeia archaeon]|nr:type II toxin-antitoxin system PemK/MazF family toxin [Candidatus Nanoarchaeia archaeon]